MPSIIDLINSDDPASPQLKQWIDESAVAVECYAPSAERDRVLQAVGVTTASTLGAVAHETGGLSIDDGWLRVLGSGAPQLPRNLADWKDRKSTRLNSSHIPLSRMPSSA